MSFYHTIFEPLRNPRTFEVFDEIGRNKLIEWRFTEDRQKGGPVAQLARCRGDDTWRMLDEFSRRGWSHMVEFFVSSQVCAYGPKIYRPSQMDCEAMENMSLNIDVADYQQPYPTMLVELPPDYTRNRIVACVQGGERRPDTGPHASPFPEQHSPAFVAVHFDPTDHYLALCAYYTSSQVFSRFFWDRGDNRTLDACLDRLHPSAHLFEDSMEISDEEWDTTMNAYRIALNCLMFLFHYGVKSLGYENESYAERLRGYVAKNRKRGDRERMRAAERELRLLPVYYTADREVKFFQRERRAGGDPTGRTVESHWRKGHYAWQRHGKRWSEKKRIIRPPVLVNEHLQGG